MIKKQTHIPYGFITGLAMIVLSVVFQVAKLGMQDWVKWVLFVAMLIGLILNAQAFSKANEADITFGDAFGSCFKATAIIVIVMVAWSFISLAIFPNIYTDALEAIRTKMERENVPEDRMEMTLNMTKKYFKIFMIGGTLFMMLVVGAIESLIAAGIVKKTPRPKFNES